MTHLPFEDRCIGCLLGTACGDVLGASVEGMAAAEIRREYGEIRSFQQTARGFGCYTDDTQMTLALAKSLIEMRRVDAEHVSAIYAEYYEPWRGYGGAAHRVMQALQTGADYRGTGRLQFPEGSFGNGGAMRIAPAGLAYRHSSDDVLRAAVADAILCTHVHTEAIDGAFLQAKAVALVATCQISGFDAGLLLRTLRGAAQTAIMQAKLDAILDCLLHDDSDSYAIGRVGNGIRASEAVAAALWALARYWRDPEQCIVRAVGFGGDTDTVAAMAGALVGTLHGTSWIPKQWYENMENGPHGRDEIVGVARELAELDIAAAQPDA